MATNQDIFKQNTGGGGSSGTSLNVNFANTNTTTSSVKPNPTTSFNPNLKPTYGNNSDLIKAPITTQPIVAKSTTGVTSTTSLPNNYANSNAPTSGGNIQAVSDLGKKYGFDSQMMAWIKEKAEQGLPLDSATPEKQAVYNAYQQYLKSEIAYKAGQGIGMDSTNAWKQGIYNDAIAQTAKQQHGDAQMSAMQDWIKHSADSQYQSQDAQLQMARDQQLAAIQKQLQDAVTQGQMSINQANQQFEAAKQGIQEQSYRDSQMTNAQMQQRGIQNSMQGMGMMAGDQARNASLLNQNVTTRDQQINNINLQLDSIRNNAAIDTNLANNQYNYATIDAQGRINQQMYDQMYGLTKENYFAQLGQEFRREELAITQGYTQDNMLLGQNLTLEQYAVQNGYDITKMTYAQKLQLESDYENFKMDQAGKQDERVWQDGRDAINHERAKEIEVSRQKHDYNMLGEQQRLKYEEIEEEFQRRAKIYTPGTPEYKQLENEADWAFTQLNRENAANQLSEVRHLGLASALAMYPTELPNPSSKKEVDAYNAKVEAANAMVQKYAGKDGKDYLRDVFVGTYGKEEGTKKAEGFWKTVLRLGVKMSVLSSTP